MKKLFRSGFAPPLLFALALALIALAPAPLATDAGPPAIAVMQHETVSVADQAPSLDQLDIEREALPADLFALQIRTHEVGASPARSGPERLQRVEGFIYSTSDHSRSPGSTILRT